MIALILPVFNESGGIREFLLELDKNLSDLNPHFVVVDDCSTDQTCEILDNLRLSNFPIHSIKNGKNSGHGFSIY
jgi:glycosyltransferase involved in cell wall biosynthesis